MTFRVLMARDGLETWFKDCCTKEECECACELLREHGFVPKVREIPVTFEEVKAAEREKPCGLAEQQ